MVPACVKSASGDKDLDSTACTLENLGTKVYILPTELQSVDLYTVGSEEPDELEISPLPEVPFVHGITVNGPQGRIVRVWGVFDSGAMVNAMCSAVYDSIKHRLSPLRLSKHQLHMADGTIIPSIGQWVGYISLGKATAACSFEVFLSGRSLGFLVGKLMQRSFSTIHNHATDEVSIPDSSGHEILANEFHHKLAADMLAYVGLRPTSDIKQREIFGRVPAKAVCPWRQQRR